MADWGDVMNAQGRADWHASRLLMLVDKIAEAPEATERDFTLAVALTGAAVCHELRALGMLLNYKRVDAR